MAHQYAAWCSDIHLDHLYSDEDVVKFATELINQDPTSIFVTGDISAAPRLAYHLSIIERVVQRPVFYVLGNHDYYGGDIDVVRKTMHDLSNMSQYLKYLPLTPYVALSKDTALVGHDGWYDALYADGIKSTFVMNDWFVIKNFESSSGGEMYYRTMRSVKNKDGVIAVARKLAAEGALHIANGIKSAARYHKNIIVATHFPPFKESHVYGGKIGDDNAQPWYTSKMTGDVLLSAAKAYADVDFTVLCGHTHGFYVGDFLPNLHVKVAGAQYGRPGLASMIEVK